MLSCSGYMAPEYIERYVLSKESDIYSLGVIIIEIVTGERKYPVGTSNEEFVEVGRRHNSQVRDSVRPITCFLIAP
jgi:serine/threonine protein kinase